MKTYLKHHWLFRSSCLSRIDLPRLRMSACRADERMKLETESAEHGVWLHVSCFHRRMALRARSRLYSWLLFQLRNALFKCGNALRQSHQSFPAGDCFKDTQHV